MSFKKRVKGFTLIELMIVLAIIGILISISAPSYKQYMDTVHRTAAQKDLIELSSFMVRYYAEHFSYQTVSGDNPSLPFKESPQKGSTHYYDLMIATPAEEQSYVLIATPKNGHESDRCGILMVDHNNDKTAKKNDVNIAGCW